MNPARSFGTAVMTATVSGSTLPAQGFYGHWVKTKNYTYVKFTLLILPMYLQVYWIGPILGGITAALVYQMLFRVVPPVEDKKEYNEIPLKEPNTNEA